MKLLIILAAMLLSLSSFADCEKEYKKFKLITLTEPVTAPVRTGLYFSTGAISSTGASLLGTLSLNMEFSTAGVLYGAAFTYEGTYFIEATLSNFKKFKGRAHALKLIIESKVGVGETLEEFIDDVNEELEDTIVLSKEEVIEEILFGNSANQFCTSKATLFTINNIKNHIVREYRPINGNDYDINDDYDDTIDIIY
jgi:hypothetical protein